MSDLILALNGQIAALEEVHKDHKRLVRELDVLINREDGAAEQASLCDLISQLNNLFPNHSIFDTCKYMSDKIAALTASNTKLTEALEKIAREPTPITGGNTERIIKIAQAALRTEGGTP